MATLIAHSTIASRRIRTGVAGKTGLLASLVRMLQTHRSRKGLARLDDHLLRDIGLTHAQAIAEADRLPWDAPPHWHACRD